MTIALDALAERISGLMQGIMDPRSLPHLPQELVWSQRVREQPAEEGDIMARFIGYIQIADMIADDQKAATYSFGKFQFESTNIPNLKVGGNMTQSLINQLLAIESRGGVQNGGGIAGLSVNDHLMRLLLNLRIGVAWRKESLIIGMLTDQYSYDRLGIKITSGTWGMPTDLKLTLATPWTDAANATPVNDLLTIALTARVRYGIVYNRVTMSTPAFRLMIATAEFQAKARQFLAPNVSYVNLTLADLPMQRSIAQTVLGMDIEFYDARFTSQAADGAVTQTPLWGLNKVVLSNSQNDNNVMAMDFANGVVTESVVSSIIGGPVQGGPQLGPIAYPTADGDLNPPQITAWAVQRGFPRKHLLQATACLSVGTVTDTISTAAPF